MELEREPSACWISRPQKNASSLQIRISRRDSRSRPDGKTLAVINPVSHSQGDIHIWDFGAGKKLRPWEATPFTGALSFHPTARP